jgi:hypothetical protein
LAHVGDLATLQNAFYYGYSDKPAVLRNEIASDSVNLIHLDPPLNSQATYNVLCAAPLFGDRRRRS